MQDYQKSKTHEKIQILSALAADVNSFYGMVNDTKKRAKHTPMSQVFPQAFIQPKKAENQKQSEQKTWLKFLYG